MQYKIQRISQEKDLVGTLELIPETRKEKKLFLDVCKSVQGLAHDSNWAKYSLSCLASGIGSNGVENITLLVRYNLR